MKVVLHVHQQRIRQGLDAIIRRTYKGSTHHREVHLHCPECRTYVATLAQHAEPDSCGARVWIDTTSECVTVGKISSPEPHSA